MSETKIFIGGSRHISRLGAEVKKRLDRIIESGFSVLIGDANGADKAVQAYLTSHRYPNVTVFCTSGRCRNNVGAWPTRDVSAPEGARGFAFYVAKDRAMAREATHSLMLWDGDSKGTLNNIVSLVTQDKPVVVFFGPTKTFATVRTREDIADLLEKCDPSAVARLEKELDLDRVLHEGARLI